MIINQLRRNKLQFKRSKEGLHLFVGDSGESQKKQRYYIMVFLLTREEKTNSYVTGYLPQE